MINLTDEQLKDYLTVELFKAISSAWAKGDNIGFMDLALSTYNHMKEKQKPAEQEESRVIS